MVMETAEAAERLEEPLAPLAQQSGQVCVVEAVEHMNIEQCPVDILDSSQSCLD